MDVVARLHDAVSAQQLVGFLRANGVPSTVSGGLLEAVGPIVGAFKGQYTVVVLRRESLERAKELAASFFAEPAAFDEHWEAETEPDLRLLNPSLLPKCPACGHQLLKVPPDDACPACHEPLDLVALVLDRHGPEALADCCVPPDRATPDNPAVRAMDVPCARCRYSLRGLSRRGRCPECGLPYDKVPATW